MEKCSKKKKKTYHTLAWKLWKINFSIYIYIACIVLSTCLVLDSKLENSLTKFLFIAFVLHGWRQASETKWRCLPIKKIMSPLRYNYSLRTWVNTMKECQSHSTRYFVTFRWRLKREKRRESRNSSISTREIFLTN